jgi:hypothetical protein
MKIFGITNRGLVVITLLVAFLWGVILTEHAMLRSTQRDHDNIIRGLEPLPAATRPVPYEAPRPDQRAASPLSLG